jgi:hypothetical protein
MVFIGTVKAIDSNFGTTSPRIDFDVEEGFAGVSSNEISLYDVFPCPYGLFKIGGKYLVYASSNLGLAGRILGVRGISKIEPLPRAASEVDELRRTLEAKQASVFGWIAAYGQPGLSGIKVTITGAGKKITKITAEDGRYDFPSLDTGTYTVTADIPSNLKDPYGKQVKRSTTLTLRAGECGKADFVGELKKGWF